MFSRLVSNSWTQQSSGLSLSKCWDYRCDHHTLPLSAFLILLMYFFYWDEISLCHPGWVQWSDLSSVQPLPPGLKGSSHFSLLRIWDHWNHRRAPPHLANFVFLVEMGFLNVGQAGLKLLTSGDLLASASQSAGITGVSHCAWPCVFLIYC